MWFGLGFLTLIASIVWSYRQQAIFWKGEPESLGEIKYWYKNETKNKKKNLYIGLNCATAFQCQFRLERWMDRFFKRIGLSKEHQTGNPDFDRKIYLLCDNSTAQEFISSHPIIAEQVVRMVDVQDYGFLLQEITVYKGRIWAVYQDQGKQGEQQTSLFVAHVVKMLQELGRPFDALPLGDSRQWVDPFLLRALVLSAVSSGLFMNAVLIFLRIQWTTFGDVLDPGLFWRDVLVVSAVIFAVLLMIAIYFVGRTSRAHYVLLELLLLGSLGTIGAVYGELYDYNIEMDTAAAKSYESTVLSKRISRGRRSTHYYMTLQRWPSMARNEEVSIGSSMYQGIQVGDSMIVTEHPGRLGYRWLGNVTKSYKTN